MKFRQITQGSLIEDYSSYGVLLHNQNNLSFVAYSLITKLSEILHFSPQIKMVIHQIYYFMQLLKTAIGQTLINFDLIAKCLFIIFSKCLVHFYLLENFIFQLKPLPRKRPFFFFRFNLSNNQLSYNRNVFLKVQPSPQKTSHYTINLQYLLVFLYANNFKVASLHITF
ncbi:hypothetical protein pb186bvf_003003 [Paramecium bursaria]